MTRVTELTEGESAFRDLFERHRRELQLHCYRMLGSLEEAEDLVQETFLRAWRGREAFQGRSSLRTWLYRIATNACLDALAHGQRRLLPSQLGPPSAADTPVQPATEVPWLQPYPDRLLEGIAPSEERPDSAVVARETIELAFLAAIQLLPPRQRAVLILRDVLGWSARETASLLESSVASANSALQRARGTLKANLPKSRVEWAPPSEPSDEERAVLQRYMEAFEREDTAAVAALLREDARGTMPPIPIWFDGRDTIITAMRPGLDRESPEYLGRWRMLPTWANRQPAAAGYLRRPGASAYEPFAIDVLRIEGGRIAEITAFDADRFPAFDLPARL
jgi:RNA polymerase sigma-70 factor (ECF subfamily)